MIKINFCDVFWDDISWPHNFQQYACKQVFGSFVPQVIILLNAKNPSKVVKYPVFKVTLNRFVDNPSHRGTFLKSF